MSSKNIQTIFLLCSSIEFEIRKNTQAKRTQISVYPDEKVVVTIPRHGTIATAVRLIKKEKVWIFKQLEKAKSRKRIMLPKMSTKDVIVHKKRTRLLIEYRLAFFSTIYSFSYGRISIRNQKTIWGSCCVNGNLNFNCRLGLLPPYLADYIIVHELCHTQEHNHSKKFWDLVEYSIPNYKKYEKELRQYCIV